MYSKCHIKFYKIKKQDSIDHKEGIIDSETSGKIIISEKSENPSASDIVGHLLNAIDREKLSQEEEKR